MIKSKKLTALVASLVVLSSITACGNANTATTAAGSSAESTAESTAAGESTTAGETSAAGTTAAGETSAAGTTAAGEAPADGAVEIDKTVKGNIETDGSSTVYPLSEAMIEIAKEEMPGLNITATASGSSAGLERLVNGEIDIAAASRPIKDEEKAKAKEKGFDVIELPVALDGIAVVVNKDNPVEEISFDQLKKAFAKDATAKTWKEVDPSFSEDKLALFSPGVSSGTFEYFTETVLETKKEQRANDVQTSEDDNVLVKGVEGEKGGLGYFGFTYYEENMDKIKALKVNGKEATKETIIDGSYPLSRPIFLYVNAESVKSKPEVKEFLKFYLSNAISQAEEIKMVPATQETINEALKKIQ